MEPLDVLGLNGFARAIGVSSDSVLAVTTTLLTGLAGPDAWLQSPWGQTRLAKLDLLTSKEDFGMLRLIDCLTAPLSLMNRRLVENKGRLSPDALDLVTSGPFSSSAAAKLAKPDMLDKALRRHVDALTPTTRPGESGMLRQDLSMDPVIHRRESLMHPQFLLRGVDGRSLKTLIEDCHQRTALVIQPALGLTREGSEPTQVIKQLFALLDGTGNHSASNDRGRDSSLPTKAHALLSLTKDEIGVLASMNADHLNRFLWVAESDGQPGKKGDGNASEAFLSALQGAAMEILELRREGRGLLVRFETEASLDRFDEESRRYEVEILQTASEAGAWARGLPQAIFWALDFLRRSASGDRKLDDEELADVAFAAARSLVERHALKVNRIKKAVLIEERCWLARRMVEEVTKHPGFRFFELARAFSCQKKERFEPVMRVLLEIQVLEIDADKRYSLGPVGFSDAEESISDAFSRV